MEEAKGLNFRDAIEAHQKWKVRLQAVIDGNQSEELVVEAVARDDQCVLGKWIHGLGDQHFSNDELFLRLRKNHAVFHQCAGNILVLAQSGSKAEANASLVSGDYAHVSMDLVLDLAQLYTRARGQNGN